MSSLAPPLTRQIALAIASIFLLIGEAAKAQSPPEFEARPPTPSARADPPAFRHLSTPRTVPATFLGMTVNKLGNHSNWPGMGVKVIRLWDTRTRWMNVEPQRGEWDFSRTDLYVDYAARNGAEVLVTLGQAPRWAVTDPDARCAYEAGCSPPADLADWRSYVRAMATRYGSRVRFWEIWNEPDEPQFWRGSPELLAQMAEIAREEILQVNPDAVLVGPAISWSGTDFLGRFLASAGGDSIDVISFHSYLGPRLPDLSRHIARIRNVAAAHGADDLPLWITEFGVWCGRDGFSCDSQGGRDASLLPAKALLVMAAEGIQSAQYYFWERALPDTPVALTSAPDFTSRTVAGSVYERISQLVAGATITESYANGGLYVIRMERAGTPMVVLWSERGAGTLRLPTDWPYSRYELLPGVNAAEVRNGRLQIPANALVVGLN